jgi:predicted HicB family RNase H-like nuclease
MKMKRGRPIGYRKPNPKSHLLFARITEDDYKWLEAMAEKEGISVGEIVRQMIENQRR